MCLWVKAKGQHHGIPGTVHVTHGPGECPLSARLRTPSCEPPVSGAGRIPPAGAGVRSPTSAEHPSREATSCAVLTRPPNCGVAILATVIHPGNPCSRRRPIPNPACSASRPEHTAREVITSRCTRRAPTGRGEVNTRSARPSPGRRPPQCRGTARCSRS